MMVTDWVLTLAEYRADWRADRRAERWGCLMVAKTAEQKDSTMAVMALKMALMMETLFSAKHL